MSRSASPQPSCFGTKGLVYLGARDFYDAKVPGGWKAVRQALRGDDAGEFMDQSFLPGGWYDVMPIIRISATAARIRSVPQSSLVRENSRWVAERDLGGVYKMLVAASSPETVAMRLPRVSMKYFDFGTFEAKMSGARSLEAQRVGIPAPLAPWFIYVTEGFVPYALLLAGAKDPRVRYGSPKVEGVALGVNVVRIRFEIDWR